MANEIANYTDILNKTSLGITDNECPNKSDILAISTELLINGSYTDDQCVLIDDIERYVEPAEIRWILEIVNNTSGDVSIKEQDGNDTNVPKGSSLNINIVGNSKVYVNLSSATAVNDSLTFYGYYWRAHPIAEFYGYTNLVTSGSGVNYESTSNGLGGKLVILTNYGLGAYGATISATPEDISIGAFLYNCSIDVG